MILENKINTMLDLKITEMWSMWSMGLRGREGGKYREREGDLRGGVGGGLMNAKVPIDSQPLGKALCFVFVYGSPKFGVHASQSQI